MSNSDYSWHHAVSVCSEAGVEMSGGDGGGQSCDSSGSRGGIQDKGKASQRETYKHDHAPVLVCEVMDERTVPWWRWYLIADVKEICRTTIVPPPKSTTMLLSGSFRNHLLVLFVNAAV